MVDKTISDCGLRTADLIGLARVFSQSAIRNSQFAMLLRALFVTLLLSSSYAAGPARFRLPAPQEDSIATVELPTLGPAAGHEQADRSLHVMEWIAKRAWHILGLPFEHKDFLGPPDMKGVRFGDDGVTITGTVVVGGVPLRNQIVSCDVEQRGSPVLVLLRSTDAFGELFIELDLAAGKSRARSVTVNRTMIGGVSHSSPLPEESSNRIIKTGTFPPASAGWHRLKAETRGSSVRLWLDNTPILVFEDPDPAGGKFGFGSTGAVGVRNVEQWELVSPSEKDRREACIRDMHEFCKRLDAEYDGDVRGLNHIEVENDRIAWTWPATGATATLAPSDGRVRATIKAGLYGNDTLIDGAFPDLSVTAEDGKIYRPVADARPAITADPIGIIIRFKLREEGSGATAGATVSIKFTVQTVWFWTVAVDGVKTKKISATLALAPSFVSDKPSKAAKNCVRHNKKAGIYFKALVPSQAQIEGGSVDQKDIIVSTADQKLRFASVILPAQPLNKIGFAKRMVHYIKYPEGPVQHWRRHPSFQEFPDNVDLARFKGNGTDAMVWHHTWLNSDFRDREGFLLNVPEMHRAMDETHRLGMATIGYIGIVPGRSSLLRIEDMQSFGGKPNSWIYEKNWDLQDFTFYHVGGRWQEYLPWMTDYWSREFGLDGFYVDGTLAALTRGSLKGPLYPEDADLSLDEQLHRLYYRVKKVFAKNHARFGLETWGGSDYMVNGFYDCQMIGESFQEAEPERYRDQYNALLAGAPYKMYGMRESSQNPYNIAMAAVCMSDIQVCSGNGAWGDVADTSQTWDRVRPFWDIIRTVDWDHLVDARPWYAQELVSGEGFYAGNYTEPGRVLIFLANRSEKPGTFVVKLDASHLPKIDAGVPGWHGKYVLGRKGDIGVLSEGQFKIELPPLHDGPIGIELTPASNR